jgi:hypothetical protein
MKIYIPLLLLIILTLSFSSCSKKDDSTAAATAVPGVSDPNTDASLGIAGQTMTIGSIDYTTSMVSSCVDSGSKTKAGASVYIKNQIFLYDNKTFLKDIYHYSDSSCTTSLGVSWTHEEDFVLANPYSDPEDNASVIAGSSVNVTGTVYDNSSNAIDNSTYFTMIYNCIGDGNPGQGGFIVYPKSATELQMHNSGSCNTNGPVQIDNTYGNLRMNMVYAPK